MFCVMYYEVEFDQSRALLQSLGKIRSFAVNEFVKESFICLRLNLKFTIFANEQNRKALFSSIGSKLGEFAANTSSV